MTGELLSWSPVVLLHKRFQTVVSPTGIGSSARPVGYSLPNTNMGVIQWDIVAGESPSVLLGYSPLAHPLVTLSVHFCKVTSVAYPTGSGCR